MFSTVQVKEDMTGPAREKNIWDTVLQVLMKLLSGTTICKNFDSSESRLGLCRHLTGPTCVVYANA